MKGLNFYLLWQATTENRGRFAFSIWHQATPGIGERASNIVTYEENPNDPKIEDPQENAGLNDDVKSSDADGSSGGASSSSSSTLLEDEDGPPD